MGRERRQLPVQQQPSARSASPEHTSAGEPWYLSCYFVQTRSGASPDDGGLCNEKGDLPLSIVPLPVFDLRFRPSYALAKSVCYAIARNS